MPKKMKHACVGTDDDYIRLSDLDEYSQNQIQEMMEREENLVKKQNKEILGNMLGKVRRSVVCSGEKSNLFGRENLGEEEEEGEQSSSSEVDNLEAQVYLLTRKCSILE